MLREAIDMIPFWWMQIICISFLTMITLGASYLSSRVFSLPNDKRHIDRSNAVIAILSGGFSVLLAFIIFTTWNYLLKAQDNAAQEANALAIMARNIAVFPEEPKTKILTAIRDYTVAVRVDEWHSMQYGHESRKAAHGVVKLYQALQSFIPMNKQEYTYYSQALINLNTIQKLRRDRLNQLKSVIPSPLSSALILGSVTLSLLLGLIRGRTRLIELIPIIVFASVLGFNLAIALSFDFPFSGNISVKNNFFYHGILKTFKD